MRRFYSAHRLCQQEHTVVERIPGQSGGRHGRKKELANRISKFHERRDRVDLRAEMRAVFEALRVVRSERAEFVDHPSVMADCSRILTHAFMKQQVDVVEQELSAFRR